MKRYLNTGVDMSEKVLLFILVPIVKLLLKVNMKIICQGTV